MSDTVSIYKSMLHDKRLKDFDVVLFMTITTFMNDESFTYVSNQKISEVTGKKLTAIKDAIRSLIEHGYLAADYNVKRNEVYKQDAKRVLWRAERFRTYQYNKRNKKYNQTTNKTKYNDFRLFVDWLKSDFTGIGVPVPVGGLVQTYKVHDDKLLYVYPTGEAPQQLEPHISNDVYKVMYSKRKTIFAWARDNGILQEDTKQHQAQVKARNDIDHPTLFNQEEIE